MKKRMIFAGLVCVVLVLAGCASRAKGRYTRAAYDKILNSWVGLSELDLLREFGQPRQRYGAQDRVFLTYVWEKTYYSSGVAPVYQTTYVGNRAYTNAVGGVAPSSATFYCEVTFELAGAKIVSWQRQGNNCVAYEPYETKKQEK